MVWRWKAELRVWNVENDGLEFDGSQLIRDPRTIDTIDSSATTSQKGNCYISSMSSMNINISNSNAQILNQQPGYDNIRPPTMNRLLASSSIHQTLTRLAYAEDELDRTALLALLVPNQTFTLDISNHLSSLAPTETTPEELWDSVYQHLAGFTATQHMLGNMLITFEDEENLERASVKCQVRAYHCLEGQDGGVESVTAHGLWFVDLEVWEGRWVCRKIVIKRDVPLDNAELYEVAKERVEKGMGRDPKM